MSNLFLSCAVPKVLVLAGEYLYDMHGPYPQGKLYVGQTYVIRGWLSQKWANRYLSFKNFDNVLLHMFLNFSGQRRVLSAIYFLLTYLSRELNQRPSDQQPTKVISVKELVYQTEGLPSPKISSTAKALIRIPVFIGIDRLDKDLTIGQMQGMT